MDRRTFFDFSIPFYFRPDTNYFHDLPYSLYCQKVTTAIPLFAVSIINCLYQLQDVEFWLLRVLITLSTKVDTRSRNGCSAHAQSDGQPHSTAKT